MPRRLLERHWLLPSEIPQETIQVTIAKSQLTEAQMFLLGVLGGAYIAMAAAGSTAAAFSLLASPETVGLGRCLAGFIFPVGLILVIIAGAELFTGNVLMLKPLAGGHITIYAMLRNWVLVYLGNATGAMFVALLIILSGQFDTANGVLGGVAISMATAKCQFTFVEALTRGILCNWLVCLAIWMSISAKDVTGKVLAIFFPIWLFITAGFEHSIANLYYVPVGIFAKTNPAWLSCVPNIAPESVLLSLTWTNFLLKNLLPVTLGNLIGGGLFVGMAYTLIYRPRIEIKERAEIKERLEMKEPSETKENIQS